MINAWTSPVIAPSTETHTIYRSDTMETTFISIHGMHGRNGPLYSFMLTMPSRPHA